MKKKIFNIVLILLINLIFVDIAFAETYNNYATPGGYNNFTVQVSCGNGLIENIPASIPKIISIIYIIIQVAVPVVLVIMGSLDLMKGITAQKDDEIKKGQQLFIKRLISAALIFLVFIIVKLIVSFASGEETNGNKTNDIMNCVECFINNECD